MRHKHLASLVSVTVLCAILISPVPAQVPKAGTIQPHKPQVTWDVELTPNQIFSQTAKETVTVTALDSDRNQISIASGFFYSDGMVATSLHAIKWASSVVVKPYGVEQRLQVKAVLVFDLVHDLCILEVENTGAAGIPPGHPEALRVGDQVYTIGNPKGFEGTFSKGMVTALREPDKLIQIDAPISPGSSGGPVLNSEGKLVGVATSSVIGGQNLNFATPSIFLDSLIIHSYPVEVIGALAIPSLEYEHLKGPVRSFLESSARVDRSPSGEQLVGPDVPKRKEVFNELGRPLEIDYFKAGLPSGMTLLTFDSRGLKEKVVFVAQDGTRSEESIEPKIRVAISASANSYSYSYKTWDTKNNEWDHRKADSRGNEIEYECPAHSEKWVTVFDSEGRETETNAYRHGRLWFTSKFSYEEDSHGNWTKKNEYVRMVEFSGSGFVLDTITKRTYEYFGNLP